MSENSETAETEAPVEPTTDSVDVPESREPGREDVVDLEQYKAKIHKANSEAKNLRQRLRETEEKLSQYVEASKTDSERTSENLTAAEKRADEAEKRADEAESRLLRLEVAQEKGLTAAQAKRLVGATREELESDADELLEMFKVRNSGRTRTHRPTESLKTGRSPDEAPEETDPRRLASKVRRW